jgi:hypothetical protein
MSQKIILKKSSVPSKVPQLSDLEYGELAINYADGILHYKTSSNTIGSIGAGGVDTGNVVGPTSAVDSNFAAFDTTTGKLIKDSGVSASSFAAASHTHSISDVTGLQDALDDKLALAGGTVTGDISFPLDRGINFGTAAGLVGYIKQKASAGQIEIGSDDRVAFFETDSNVEAVVISTNSKTVTASGGFIGNASTATKLLNARTIALSGDVSGSASFDGSGNVTITTSVADDSHNHVISNVDGLQTALDGKLTISWIYKTANYTAINGNRIIANTTAGSFTVTLPSSPQAGYSVIIADGGNWNTNNLTVGRNGATIEGLAEDLLLDLQSITVTLVYSGTTWIVVTSAPTVQAATPTTLGSIKIKQDVSGLYIRTDGADA